MFPPDGKRAMLCTALPASPTCFQMRSPTAGMVGAGVSAAAWVGDAGAVVSVGAAVSVGAWVGASVAGMAVSVGAAVGACAVAVGSGTAVAVGAEPALQAVRDAASNT